MSMSLQFNKRSRNHNIATLVLWEVAIIMQLRNQETGATLTSLLTGEYPLRLPLAASTRNYRLLPTDCQEGFHLYSFCEQFSIFSHRRYPECHCINFGSWFMLSFPAAIIILFLSWIWLQWLFLGFK